MRVLLVVNSAASSVTARRQVLVKKIFAADHDLEVAETSRRGHATNLALDAARNGCDVVVVLGGDGTLNEVANGLVGTDCAIAALPGGSTNVFARAIGLPDEPTDAALAVSEALGRGWVRRMGVGWVNGRVFLFHVGVGWDAALVEEVERHAELKRYAGHALFVYAGVKTFFGTYDRSRPHFRIVHADGTVVDDAYFSVCLNLNPYTFVGNRPFNLSTEATLDRGLANVGVLSMRTLPFLALIGSALGTGERLRSAPSIDYRADLSAIRFEAFDQVPYQVDGDHIGDTTLLELTHQPDALALVVPPTGSYR
jgi:diacylglycerol kinase family enzyme